MDSTLEGSSDAGGTMTVNNFTTNSTWATAQTPVSTSSNSTLLFIAVEYVKETNEYKFETDASFSPQQPTSCTDFQQHVSPLDPNMSSAARYSPGSPSYAGSTSYTNPVVVQQLIAADTERQLMNTPNEAFVGNLPCAESSLPGIPTAMNTADNLLKQVVSNRYMVDEHGQVADGVIPTGALQLVSDAEQEVELLITDQATGISYSVSTQEYLVERCLADQQHLLDALTPDPLLDSELLALDETTLKSQLHDVVDTVAATVLLDSTIPTPTAAISNTPASTTLPQLLVKSEEIENNVELNQQHDTLRRSQRQNDILITESEEQLLSRVHSIIDKPVLSRARATLPASYLIINKLNDEYGVFARKLIPKRTQFGPLEGVPVPLDSVKVETSKLQLYVEDADIIFKFDISDENTANWMCFVRKASTYAEQNLVLTQQGSSLYYTTTKNILPKQELMVGYSTSYAQMHNLEVLQPLKEDQNEWPCFECNKYFTTSDELQKHLNVHEENLQECVSLLKKSAKHKRKLFFKKIQNPQTVECNICKEVISPKYTTLRKHLCSHGVVPDNSSFEEKFTILKNREDGTVSLESEGLLKINNLQEEINDEQVNVNCTDCQRQFSSQKELLTHLKENCTGKSSPEVHKGYKCPVCYKVFASRERIQRHMLVHGSEDLKPLKCEICHKRFLTNSALACHLKTHNVDKKMFECPICKQSFDHVLQLKVHVTQHCTDGKYTCPHCSKLFKEYSIIRKHIRAFHCDRKHACPHCTKPFPTVDKLRMHLLRHSDHREFLCADCGKQFKRKDKLKEHTKRMHSEERENTVPRPSKASVQANKKFTPRVQPTDYHRFIYKCHACLVGFKRRGMLVNHLAKRHPDISPDSVPELNLPILRTTRDYYCQYCDKVYKSSSKRKAHILKNHPGQALPMSNRRQGSFSEVAGLPNPTFSQTVGSVTTHPQACQWCHKQYASKAKLLQHQRKKHLDYLQTDRSHVVKSPTPPHQVSYQAEEINIDTHSFKRDFKVSDEELLSEVVALNGDRDDTEYYQIIPVSSSDSLNFVHSGELSHTPDSRLYRLLTTGNGLVPPR